MDEPNNITALDPATIRTKGPYTRVALRAVKAERRRLGDRQLRRDFPRQPPPGGWEWIAGEVRPGFVCGLVRL